MDRQNLRGSLTRSLSHHIIPHVVELPSGTVTLLFTDIEGSTQLHTIAQTLGVREQGTRPIGESVRDPLKRKQLLLALDNFEQVIAAAPFVAELAKEVK